MTVMVTTSILFMLSTTLLMMVAYQTSMTGLRVGRVRATHVADAGVNAYLYTLKSSLVSNPSVYMTASDTGWVTVGEGERYRVVTVPPAGRTPLTIYSTGAAGDGTVTIAATIRFPTFGDYMLLTDASLLSIAADANIDGQLRTNGNLDNKGKISGKVLVSGTVVNAGKLDQGYTAGVPKVDFNQLAAAMTGMATAAKASGTYYPDAGLGYRVIVNGSTATISKITGGITTGDFVTVPVATVSIPSSGILYFAGIVGADGTSHDVWVEGSYGVPVTIVSDTDIYITADYLPSDANSTVTSGLIAHGSVVIPSFSKNMKDYLNVNAALIAATGSIYSASNSGTTRSRITIVGAMAFARSADSIPGYKTNGQAIPGFRDNQWTYDQRLNQYPPPMYPVIIDSTLKVDTWLEDTTPVQ